MARNAQDQIERDWGETIALMKVLCNPIRLYIVTELLGGDECSVGYFVSKLKLEFSVISKHLSILRHAGIVTSVRDTQWVYYKLSSPKTASFVRELEKLNETLIRES
ncbi:MAG: metalloregulator ArsR/SmtB family transcription factor [Planctomycetia bacterium]|nr:metalloregulator ArsR/SmtB family transcription factor [Planctomycetia bacterium]